MSRANSSPTIATSVCINDSEKNSGGSGRRGRGRKTLVANILLPLAIKHHHALTISTDRSIDTSVRNLETVIVIVEPQEAPLY